MSLWAVDLPQLAQVAIQQGKSLKGIEDEKILVPFKYKDQGSMAIISKFNAVVDLPNFLLKDF
ncbi:MAG: hypothetical protein P0Y62_06905 [Candidatus Chryseobacterium colombiense]|nr:hypothetical protein [Chryseobacterium sp.]WEK71281.1 MAG: hypothetical protein P0Y62_06905 [Chryseobacterium sp.]